MPTIEYVDVGETIADIAITEKTSTSLTATTSILLSILLVVSFLSNLLLVATILASCKLRKYLLYLMFCQLGIINILDTVMIMLVALLYVANGNWTFGDAFCRANAWTQQFVFLYALFTIMLMSMERALGLTANGRHFVTPRYALVFSTLFTVIAFCFAAPTFFSAFPVHPYPWRYLCAIGGQSPVAYSIVQMVAYGGCIFVMTICFGALIRYNNIDRSLPARPQDYGAFIMESRALQDYMIHGRLVMFICIAFVIVQGPYIILSLFVQIRNSNEILHGDPEMEMSQDVDTLITWLKLFFPLIVTVLIYSICHDIWIKLMNLIWCRRSNGIHLGSFSANNRGRQKDECGNYPPTENVLTLVATTDGLQIRVPDGHYLPPVQQTTDDQTNHVAFQLPNQRSDEIPPEMKTQKIINPKVLRPQQKSVGFTPKVTVAKNSKIPRSKRSPNKRKTVNAAGRLKFVVSRRLQRPK
ncbi:Melanin-concentrating hormone receptor 2 [Aphelenchoides besseyi]|nr:Melanin-concentrating hormone receptor 2 [Aphelenchoides besseyi]KAI6235975.1 Melanin-concentrating hormone receptor 2 [Aphelenchoides besseyi]